MSIDTTTAVSEVRIAAMVRQHEVEQFLYGEAALLDARRYSEWLALFADDATYFMPIRRTRMQSELDQEFTKPGEMAFFNDTKPLLAARVTKLGTGRSWAEDPPSRTRRLITNIRVIEDNGAELVAASNFMLYRTRLNSQEDSGMRLAVLVLAALGAHAATPLFNSSLERPATAWTAIRGSANPDSAVLHEGKQSLRVEPAPGTPDAAVRSAPVALVIGKRYELTGWVCTQSLTVADSVRTPIGSGAALTMASMPFDVHSASLGGTQPWTRDAFGG